MNRFFTHLAAAYGSRTEPESQRFLAQTAWHAVLAFLAVTSLAAFVWGAVSLGAVFAALEQPADTSRMPAPPLDKAALMRTIDTAAVRAASFQSLSSAPAKDTDPAR